MGEWIEIELVEEPAKHRRVAVDPATPKPPRHPPRLEGRDRRLLGIGAAVVIVAGVGWAVARSGDDVSTGAPPATLDESTGSSPEQLAVDTTQPRPSTTRARATTTTVPLFVVEQLGGPMLPTASGLQLVGLTPSGDLLDIDLDTGQLTTTHLPGGSSGSPATILAGEEWTHVRRWDMSSSFLVPRNELPVEIGSPGDFAGDAYRGPDPGTFWALRSDPRTGAIVAMDLVDLEGVSLERSIDLHGWWPMQSDLAGGVVVQAGGDVYVVSEAGARRVAEGEMVGVGLNHFLVRDCDEALVCGLFVVDRQGGERRQVPVIQVDGRVAQFYGWTGTDTPSISPDGTAAVLVGLDGGGSGVALLGIDTGVYRTLASAIDTLSVAWSDDSRYVAYIDNRTLRVYDRLTADTFDFGDSVPNLVNFAARP